MVEIDTPPDETAERTARHRAILKELAEIGMDIARAVRAQAQDDPKASAGADLAFTRIARAVRQTLALEARMAEEGFARAHVEAARRQKAQDSHELTQRLRIVGREATVHHVVTQAIEIEAEETDKPEPVENLLDALDDAMRVLDLSDERPIGAIVDQICKDLGVTIDWTYCMDEPWAREERQTRPPGSPFANGVPKPIWPDWSDYDPDEIPPRGSPEYEELRQKLSPPPPDPELRLRAP